MQTFINSRFEQIEKRFGEIQLILDLASSSRGNIDLYQALCRSAHVLLVGHFEGLYKEICRDVIVDIMLIVAIVERSKLNTRFRGKVITDIYTKMFSLTRS